MDTLTEIQHALERLSFEEREAIASWLQEFTEAQPQGLGVAEPRSSYAVVQPPFMTVDEYMEFEERSPIRHEYVNGAIYAMNGVSVAHARITRELASALRGHLRGGPCEPFSSDLKLLIRSDTDEVIYYPDVMVACDREHWGPNYVPNPKLVPFWNTKLAVHHAKPLGRPLLSKNRLISHVPGPMPTGGLSTPGAGSPVLVDAVAA